MFLIDPGTPVFLILITFAVGVQSAPHATQLSVIQQCDRGITRRANTFSQIGCLSDCSEDRLGHLMALELTEPQEQFAEAHISTSSHVAPLAAPLACVTSLLLILLILKATYLKNRRLRTIHELPSLCAAWSEVEDEESTDDHVLPRFEDVHAGVDLHSMQSRFCRRAPERSSSLSSKSEPVHRQLRDSLPGVLVGMLGSPDWETRMQREFANHQWRLRRESHNLSIRSQHRHTWHSQQSCAYSRNSVACSHFQSTARNHSDQRPGRHSSLRIPRVSSFGEMYPDTFRDKRRRPRSLNAVIDQMSTSRSGPIPNCSPASSNIRQLNPYANETAGGSGFSVPTVSLSQRPSTIREVDTPPPTVTLPQEAIFRFQVTDYGDGMPSMNSAAASSAESPFMLCFGGTESGFGSADMELSSTYEHLNASRESSLGSSWRQLPHFPSPPASPGSPELHTPQFPDAIQVNAVRVHPHFFRAGFYGAMSTKSGIFGASGLRLLGKDRYSKSPRKMMSAFSPLTLDLGSPALSDLVVSELLKSRSSPVDEIWNNGKVHVRQSPVKSEFSSPPALKQQFLDPFTAAALNRNHSRVREHVPFSIITPPPAYLKSPRSLERSVRVTWESESVEDDSGKYVAVPYATSLVDLSAPVRPSPLRRVASLGSIGSSRTSLRSSMKPSNISLGSNASSDAAMDRAGVNARESRESSLQIMVVDPQTLRPRASHTSLFLDLGGSSPGYDDDRSESYSFGIAESLGIDQSFNYSQASSSGIVVIMEDCSDEDADHIVEMHSDSFAGVQNND